MQKYYFQHGGIFTLAQSPLSSKKSIFCGTAIVYGPKRMSGSVWRHSWWVQPWRREARISNEPEGGRGAHLPYEVPAGLCTYQTSIILTSCPEIRCRMHPACPRMS